MIYSAGVLNVPSPVTEGLWMRHVVLMLLAIGVFLAVTRIPTRWFEWASLPAYIFWVAVLGVTLAVGTGAGTASGVKAFLSIGGFRFQPSEAAKIATILYLARVLGSRDRPLRDLRDLVKPLAIVGETARPTGSSSGYGDRSRQSRRIAVRARDLSIGER
jgi:cell division protein FtsW (lipid II flippase)